MSANLRNATRSLSKKKENNHRCLVTSVRDSTSLWIWEKAEAFHRIYGKLELSLG